MRTLPLGAAKAIGHEVQSVVVYASSMPPGVGGAGPSFPATVGAPAQHLIQIPGLPAGSKLLAAWYTPTDRVHDLPHFVILDVNVIDDTHVRLSAQINPGVQKFCRLAIHVLFLAS